MTIFLQKMLNLVLFCLGNLPESQLEVSQKGQVSQKGSHKGSQNHSQNHSHRQTHRAHTKAAKEKAVPSFRFKDEKEKLVLLDWLAREELVPLTRSSE